MNTKHVTLTLAAAGLTALLIIPAPASAKGPRECGHRSCAPVESCQPRRWSRSGRRPVIVDPAPQGRHAIRGWAPPYRYVGRQRGSITIYFGGWR